MVNDDPPMSCSLPHALARLPARPRALLAALAAAALLCLCLALRAHVTDPFYAVPPPPAAPPFVLAANRTRPAPCSAYARALAPLAPVAHLARPQCALTPAHAARYAALRTPGAPPVFLALNVLDAQRALAALLHELPGVLAFLGPGAFVSVLESGSRDATPGLLGVLARLLAAHGVAHRIEVRGGARLDKRGGRRIAALARVRNEVMEPLYDGSAAAAAGVESFGRVLFMNDIIFCAADMLEILYEHENQGADMTCALDWGNHIVYDRWVLRTMTGSPSYAQSELLTFFAASRSHPTAPADPRVPIPQPLPWNPAERARLRRLQPFQVFSCWNGAAVISADAFTTSYNHSAGGGGSGGGGIENGDTTGPIRFRTARNDATPVNERQSECFLLPVDLWRRGMGRIQVVPRASVAYTGAEYEEVRQDGGRAAAQAHPAGLADVPLPPSALEGEKIEWEKRPPAQVLYHDYARWDHPQVCMEPPSAMFPAPAVFNTPNAGGNAQINNVNGDFIHTLNVHSVTPDRGERYALKFEVQRLSITTTEKEIYQWLAAPDTSGNYNAAREKHHENTGAWFLEGDEFVHWKETPGSALWINGTPGSGKTVICSTVIESVRQEYKPESGAACAYFFFDSRNAETDQSLHEKMLRSLIRQLSHQFGLWCKARQSGRSVGVPAALMEMYGGGHEKPSVAALQLTLQKIIADLDRAYIVIDALDECIDRDKLLAWIGGLLQHDMDQLRILFSSRREHDILQRFEPMQSVCSVSLAGASTNADIGRYVDDMLATVARWNAATRARIKRSLMEGVDGMFRWVAFQIAELFKCLAPRAVDAQLRSLPKDLDGMYERSLSRSANPHELKQLLIWLAFSMRPLQLQELAEVTAIDLSSPDTPAYDPDLRYFSPIHVLDICAGFVTFIPAGEDDDESDGNESNSDESDDDESNDSDDQLDSRGTVKLAHMSVKDYLVSDRMRGGAASFFGINAILAHSMITVTCLAYLLHLGSHSSFDKTTFQKFPLVSYAAHNWLEHVKRGHSKEFTPVWQLMIRMFSRGHNALTNCFQLKNPHRYPHWHNGFHTTAEELKDNPPLYYASLLGMEELVEEILRSGEDVQVGGPCGNALQAASYHGHEGVVRTLLEHGARVNARGRKGANSLRAACYGGHINVARLLLKHGADVDAPINNEGTLLQEAAGHDDFAAVQLLLEHSADVNAPGYKGTSLQNASRCGKYDLVRLLLEHGADAAPAGPKGTALQLASRLVKSDIVRLLLEHGADVNTPGGPEGTALQAAISWPDPGSNWYSDELDCGTLEASRRSCVIVRLMIERGAEVNAPAGPKGTALQIASGRGEIDIVRLLLEHGADANALGGPEGTALQAVISWADPVKQEYEHQNRYMPPFSTRLKLDFTPLILEASRRGCAIIRLLIEHGAEVNAPAGPKGTALQIASGCGEIDIVRLLLENGANANALGGPKGTALQAVISWADLGKQKHEYGNSYLSSFISEPKPDRTSPIMEAFRRGCAIVQLLIERGAEVNAPAGPEGTALRIALRIASGPGEIDIVRLLFEHGADANGLGRPRRISIFGLGDRMAQEFELESRKRMLFKYGANVNAPAGPEDTLLQEAAHRGDLKIVQLLLEHSADVNAPAGPSGTALQAAVSNWCWTPQVRKVIRLLIENGANVNAPGGFKDTPLLYASNMGDEDVVRLMLEHGAVMGSREAEDFIFLSSKGPNHAEILQLLLDSEAAGVDREWLNQNRAKWVREGRIKAKDYDSIELWGNFSTEASENESGGDSDSDWHTPDEGSAPASPVQNSL
ncbi:hypothetical protein HWV62_79 [Athelia sp. TMB]|nr:hypothetical protein HWV62_79 [Athelia sp. TMB]